MGGQEEENALILCPCAAPTCILPGRVGDRPRLPHRGRSRLENLAVATGEPWVRPDGGSYVQASAKGPAPVLQQVLNVRFLQGRHRLATRETMPAAARLPPWRRHQ